MVRQFRGISGILPQYGRGAGGMAPGGREGRRMVEVICPTCGHTLRIPDEYAGQSGRCNGCGGRIVVPDACGRPDDPVVVPPGPVDSRFDPAVVSTFPASGIRPGTGMLANEGSHGGGIGASAGRIAVLGCLFGLLAVCVLPGAIIGLAAKPDRPVESRPRSIPAARANADSPSGANDMPGPDAGEADPIVYLATVGSVYHHANCAQLRNGRVPLTRSAALLRGYEACGDCSD